MKKPLTQQFILLIAALVIAVLLFQLPKDILDNKTEGLAETQSVEVKVDQEGIEHGVNIPDSVRINITKFRKLYKSVSDNENNLIFADSLAAIYDEFFYFDSSSYYLESKLAIAPTLQNYEEAALALFKAFSLAESPETKAAYGNKALKYIDVVLDEHPDRLNLMTKKAIIMVETVSPPMQGIALLKEVLEKDPSNIEALRSLGEFSIQSGQLDKALERFKTILEYDPENVYAYVRLGDCYAGMGQNDKAEQNYIKAQQLQPDDEFIQKWTEMALKKLKH